jgi:hypothetical protein
MAVTAYPHPRTRTRTAPLATASLPPLVLVLILVPPALDLVGYVQASRSLELPALVAAALAAVGLGVSWPRMPGFNWLFAATFAAVASLAMRVAGADVASALSLLTILAVGLGGAFGSPSAELDHCLDEPARLAA